MAGLIFRKVKKTLSYLEEKPEVYALQNITLPKVSYEDMVEEIAQSQGVNKSQTKSVIEAFLNRSVFLMKLGHPISMGGVGTFKPTFNSKVATRLENLSADNIVQKKIRYIPGKELRQMIEEINVSGADNLDDAE